MNEFDDLYCMLTLFITIQACLNCCGSVTRGVDGNVATAVDHKQGMLEVADYTILDSVLIELNGSAIVVPCPTRA